jgi:2,4-dichlorophenol 6-monooxygenase
MRATAGAEEEVPVLIVGGGGAGLTSSMLLARLGVEHLLVSARPQTSDLPKAHVLNQRTMEVLEDVGVADAIARRSTPAGQMAATAFYAGFAGPGPEYGRRLARLECWGAGGADDSWRAASPWRQLNLPQIRLEPLLKARAEELSPGRIRFGHELTGLEQDGEGVRATVRDNTSGRRYVVRCQYLLGADGGRRIASLARRRVRGARCGDADRDAARVRRLLAVGEGSGRPDPLDLLAAGRRPGGDGPDGAGSGGALPPRSG